MLDASRVISGTYGYVYIDGVWQTNFNQCDAKATLTKKELLLSGDPWTRHKKGAIKGTGTMAGYKVTSDMINRGFTSMEVIVKLDDPEAFGYERVKLKNVMPDDIQLANFKAGDEVTESIPFTFEGYELLDPIVAT